MGKLSTIANMSRYDQMNYYRAKRKEALAAFQASSNQASGLISVKLSESQGLGNLAAKMAYQRGTNKTA